MDIPRLVIAGERSGVGKTTITVGILLALKKRGLIVQPYKVGPDFLDPMHHSLLLDRKSRNLDTWMFPSEVTNVFARGLPGADVAVIEGVMGLYDGIDGRNEIGSTAHLSKVLKAPVVLVLNAASSARSIGAVALGFKEYDREVNVAGVIFNNVSSPDRLELLRDSLKDMECLGGIPRSESIGLESRHLGLVPANESTDPDKYDRIRAMIEGHVDVDRLLEVARSAPDIELPEAHPCMTSIKARIGVATDAAFNFYYQDNLDILRDQGAELLPFSPMEDAFPDVDGMYFGGGYPELFASKLETNTPFKEQVRSMAMNGMPIYAECGGMMYLCRGVKDMQGRRYLMAGVFDAEVELTGRLQAIGYVEAKVIPGLRSLANRRQCPRSCLPLFTRDLDIRRSLCL